MNSGFADVLNRAKVNLQEQGVIEQIMKKVDELSTQLSKVIIDIQEQFTFLEGKLHFYVEGNNKRVNSNEDSINDEENNKSNDNINNNIYRSNSFKKIKIKNAPKIIKYTETTPEGFSYIYIENLEEDVTLIENANYQHFE
jgi:hypothetical protein